MCIIEKNAEIEAEERDVVIISGLVRRHGSSSCCIYKKFQKGLVGSKTGYEIPPLRLLILGIANKSYQCTIYYQISSFLADGVH